MVVTIKGNVEMGILTIGNVYDYDCIEGNGERLFWKRWFSFSSYLQIGKHGQIYSDLR